jgi:hypothetical protein
MQYVGQHSWQDNAIVSDQEAGNDIRAKNLNSRIAEAL